ncbi:hypothetical protein JOC27_001367 [Sporolactobacillus spathodeae]|uniref:Uncharacterized protein n=1 Tax=Sporolactobacillus spathodeae TaxID=1465502 RepID=A0ABS2Q8D7_9BACL|nr:hypothetical protein [Sporolactobacillus spathodeae]
MLENDLIPKVYKLRTKKSFPSKGFRENLDTYGEKDLI